MTARRIVIIAVCLLGIAVHALVIADRRAEAPGDFDVSREFGRRFVEREPLYAGGLHYVYQPAAALFFAPLAFVPAPVGFAFRYATALAGLWLILRLLNRMVARCLPAVRLKEAEIGVWVVALGSHYVIRDLDDGGPHLVILAIVVCGLATAAKGRTAASACLLGLAVAVKTPYGVLIPFLAWKRQWALAGALLVSTAAWSAAPALWMGPADWWAHEVAWIGAVASGPRPTEMRPQNLGIRPTVLRYAGAEPADPRAQIGRSGEAAASDRAEAVAMAVVLVLAGTFLWATRRRTPNRTDPVWLLEISGVLILSALFSPVTWVQHLVVALPALYLVVAEGLAGARFGAPATAAMLLYATLTLALNREVLGRERYVWLIAHGMHAVALLTLLAVLVWRRPTVR